MLDIEEERDIEDGPRFDDKGYGSIGETAASESVADTSP